MERGVLDVVSHHVGFRGVYSRHLAAGSVFSTYLKEYIRQPLWVSIILFFDAEIRIIIKTAHSTVQFFAR